MKRLFVVCLLMSLVIAIPEAQPQAEKLDLAMIAKIRMRTQGNSAVEPIFRQWMEPLKDLAVFAYNASMRDSRLPRKSEERQ